MRVLLTVDPEIPVPPRLYGGIERIVDGLATELRCRGHQVGLVGHQESTCPVNYFQPWPLARASRCLEHWRQLRALMSAVREWRPDVVHSFSRLAYLAPLLATRQRTIMSYQRHTGGPRLAVFG